VGLVKLDFGPMRTREDGCAVIAAERRMTRSVGLSLDERGDIPDPKMLENLQRVFGDDNSVF
jgi:hypothetical protein